MKIISDNGTWFKKATVRLSTVTLPASLYGESYETAIWTPKLGWDEIIRTDNVPEAIKMHRHYTITYLLKFRSMMVGDEDFTHNKDIQEYFITSINEKYRVKRFP